MFFDTILNIWDIEITCWWQMDEGNVYILQCYSSIKDLPWDLRVSVIYGHKNINLDGSLILWPISKIIVIGSVLGPVSSPTVCSWPDMQYQKHVSSCEVGHKSKQNVLGCPPNICATNAHKGISCYAREHCSSQGSLLVKTAVLPHLSILHYTF